MRLRLRSRKSMTASCVRANVAADIETEIFSRKILSSAYSLDTRFSTREWTDPLSRTPNRRFLYRRLEIPVSKELKVCKHEALANSLVGGTPGVFPRRAGRRPGQAVYGFAYREGHLWIGAQSWSFHESDKRVFRELE